MGIKLKGWYSAMNQEYQNTRENAEENTQNALYEKNAISPKSGTTRRHGMNPNARRSEIVRILRSDPNVCFTAQHFANYFETDERTIRRDILVLISDEHRPVVMIPGRGGGIRYVGTKDRQNRILSIEQTEAIKRAIKRAESENLEDDVKILQSVIDVYG
jgi:hypothetical protein